MENNKKNIIKIEKLNEVELLNQYRIQLMGFSALWIIFFHTWMPMFGNYKYISTIEIFIKVIGYYGVDIFFFLSGIGLTYSIKKSNLKEFYYKRIKRVVLPFLIMSVLLKICNNWNLLEWIKNVSFYNFYTKSIYAILWFVPAIITIYIIFPIYYKILKKISHKTLFTVMIIFIISIILIVFRKSIRRDLYGFFNRIPIFIIGILIGWKHQNQKIAYNKNRYKVYIIILTIGLVIAYIIKFKYWYFLDSQFDLFLPNLLVAISISFLLPVLFENNAKSKKRTIKKINKLVIIFLKFIGTMSFEIYCVQELIFYSIYRFKNVYWFNLIVFLEILIFGSILYIINKFFWIVFEKIIEKNIKVSKEKRICNDKV